MKNLSRKIREGAKKTVKAGLPLVVGGILSTSNVDAQSYKSGYDSHDIGGKFRKYEVTSNDILEEKVFYNPVTKKDDRFYINYLDKEGKKIYEDDLDIAGFSFEESNVMIQLGSSEVEYITSPGIYHYREVEEFDQFVMDETHVGNRCPDQIILLANGIDPTKMSVSEAKKKADGLRGYNYISQSKVKDYDDSMPLTPILELGNGEEYFVYPLNKEQQEEGKTNHILIPLTNDNYWTYDPKTKDIIIQGTFYRGIRDSNASIITEKGVKRLGTGVMTNSDSTGIDKKAREEIKDEINKQDKEPAPYVILGANTDGSLISGELGLQYGPIALVGSYGFGEDFQTKDVEAQLNKGRIFSGEEFMTDIRSKGLTLEGHLFSQRKVSPFIGIGAERVDYTLEGKEKLETAKGVLIDSDSYNKNVSENFYKINAGVDFKIGDRSKLGFNIGYTLNENSTENLKNDYNKGKFSGGVRFTRKIGRR